MKLNFRAPRKAAGALFVLKRAWNKATQDQRKMFFDWLHSEGELKRHGVYCYASPDTPMRTYTCTVPGCGEFQVPVQRGMPPKWCPEHRRRLSGQTRAKIVARYLLTNQAS